VRDAAAIATVAVFLFPLLWWGLTPIRPVTAIFDKSREVWFDFVPTLANYGAILAGLADGSSAILRSARDTLIVAASTTALSIGLGGPAAFALSQFSFFGHVLGLRLILLQRFLPPVALVIPLVGLYHAAGLLDTHVGLILADTLMTLPIAVLLLKSFFDEVPREVTEAASIDGASRWVIFTRISLPLCRGGVAATAILCFLFAWTEFLFAVFLTSFVRTLPVTLSVVSEFSWGLTAALSVVSIVPAFAAILVMQRHLVRGLTLGLGR
jgi:multiple sugar transport system permease protein